MTVQEYRHRLERAMEGCSPDEIENAVEYYGELIEDSEFPEEQMEKLGSPEELAERIKREGGWIQPVEGIPADDRQAPPPQGFGGQYAGAQQQTGSSSSSIAGRIIALVLTFPFWIAAFAILISLFFVIWGIYIAFPSGAISALVCGFAEFRTYPAYGGLILTAMLAMAGLSVLLVNLAVNLTRFTGHVTASFAKFLFAPNAKGQSFVWKKIHRLAAIIGVALLGVGVLGSGAVFAVAHPNSEKYAEKLGLTDKEYSLSADASGISADIDIGNVIVKQSGDGSAKLVAENIVEDCLTVNDGNNIDISYDLENKRAKQTFNFDMFGISSGSKTKAKFTLYLPEKDYDTVTLTASLGKVELGDLKADTLNVKADCGDIKLNDTTAVTMVIEESLGKIDIKNVTADSADISNDCGAVKVKDSEISGSVKAELSLGEGKFEDVTVGSIDAKLDCGNFKFTGTITEGGRIELDTGNADIKLSGQGYDVDASADTGDVDVDSSLKGGSVKIDVKNDCGNINVKAA